MTEDEAREKWCPFARVSIHAPEEIYGPHSKDFVLTGNRWQAESTRKSLNVYPEGAQCIASDCMAWRALYEGLPFGEETKVGGYCGLAGKP